MYWLKIFFENLLGFTDRLNGQFLIAHCIRLHAIKFPSQRSSGDLVPHWNHAHQTGPAGLARTRQLIANMVPANDLRRVGQCVGKIEETSNFSEFLLFMAEPPGFLYRSSSRTRTLDPMTKRHVLRSKIRRPVAVTK
jgi:hypothetical protein